MRMSVVVPVRNDARRLDACLASLCAGYEAGNIELIVADNGSTDESADVAARAGARVLSLPNLPVSALRNAAARAANGDLLAFVDADHQVVGGWIAAALQAMSDPAVGAAGARYTPPPNGTWVQRMYGVLRGRTVGVSETDWLGSGNMIVRREAFARVGGFDETLEACEDVDLCRRLRAAGFRIVADERLLSVHHGDPPTLAALFRAERWRGRDNLRVSLRGQIKWRDLPSVIGPILFLAGVASLAVSLLLTPFFGSHFWMMAGLSAGLLLALASVRTVRMAASLERTSLIDTVRAFAAALVYETARATALVTRAPHHRR